MWQLLHGGSYTARTQALGYGAGFETFAAQYQL